MPNESTPPPDDPTAPLDAAGRAAPITRATLHDELVGRLRDLIIEGDLAPGTKIPERRLCERFGVSRTPLREALKVLASEGLLDLSPNRGATVARLTVADLDEMFPVMGALEALAGNLACARIADEEIAEIRALHYQMVLHHTRRELPQYFRLNQRIHQCIMAAADNRTLSRMYAGLSGRIRRARYMANMTQERWDRAVEEHEAILDALSRRDGARLGRILQEHLHNKGETVKESLLAEPAPEQPRRRAG